MRIHLATIGVNPAISAVRDFENLAALSSSKRHDIVDDPESADVVLFTECHQMRDPLTVSRIWKSKTFKEHRRKCYVFDQRPRAYCSIPGLYTSVPWRSLHPQFQIPWSYHHTSDLGAQDLPTPDLLFSFMGTTVTHRSRRPLMDLAHPRGLVERVDNHVPWQPGDPGYEERRAAFRDSLHRSAFVLCPRGRATSSFRFYEAMSAGRVPVVISDAWVPPWGVDLSSFAIRWPEGRIDGLVDYLERNEHRAPEMGRRAREVWEQRFAPEVMWDNIGDALDLLSSSRPWSVFPRWGYPPDRRIVRSAVGRARRIIRDTASRARTRR